MAPAAVEAVAVLGGGDEDETDSEDEIDVENVPEEEEEEEEEEDVKRTPAKKNPASKNALGKRKRGSAAEKEDPDGVSPLDALLQMTSKAFDGRQDAKNQGESPG